MKKPILNEVFADNGEHSHWNLIDPITGENLWSEDPEEDKALGFPVCERKKEISNPEIHLPQADVIKSVCEKCRFKSDCRYKEMNTEQNCKYFIDEQIVL